MKKMIQDTKSSINKSKDTCRERINKFAELYKNATDPKLKSKYKDKLTFQRERLKHLNSIKIGK